MIAIIGGSGLYSGLSALTGAEQSEVETPFGSVSCTKGRLGENEVIFISRHGDDHPVPPHRVPYKAHIRALKDLGVTRILATSAVGALDEDIPLGSLVLPDQFIDFTRETRTFFEGGESGLVHLSLSDPFCSVMRKALLETGRKLALTLHGRGVYTCIDGPHFETLAEAKMLRTLGGTIAGMTAVPEAKLARELEICYQVVAIPVDYPAQEGAEVSHAQTLKIMGESIDSVARLFVNVMDRLPEERICVCSRALDEASG